MRKNTILLGLLILFIGIALTAIDIIFKHSAALPLKISIHSPQNSNDIKVLFNTIRSKAVVMDKSDRMSWAVPATAYYITDFSLKVPKEIYFSIEEIVFDVGRERIVIQHKNIPVYFSCTIANDGFFLVSNKKFKNRSLLPVISSIINWCGDISSLLEILFRSFIVLAITVLFYLSICFYVFSLKKAFFLRKIITRHRSWLPYMGVVCFVLLTISIFQPVFLANDDLAILNDIRNGFDVSFMSVFLGRILSFLYIHISMTIPWYGLFLYLLYVLSLCLILRTTTVILPKSYKRLFILFLIFLLYIVFLVEITFTTAALLVVGSALYAFLVLGTKCELQKKWFKILMLGFYFALGCAVRLESFFAAIVFVLPVLLLFLLRAKNSLEKIGIFFIPFFIFVIVNNLLFTCFLSEQQKEFIAFNSIRGYFHEYPIAKINVGNEKILKANNWTVNDYMLFSNWMFWDESLYNLRTVENIYKYSLPITHKTDDLFIKVKVFLELYGVYFLSFIFLLLFINLRIEKSILVYLIYVTVVVMCMFLFMRFPVRIGFPLLFSVMQFILYFYLYRKNKRNFMNKYLLLVILSLIMMLSIDRLASNYKRITYLHNVFIKNISSLNSNFSSQDIILICPGSSFREQYVNPLKNINIDPVLFTYGWNTFSPRFYSEIERFLGVNEGRDLLKGLMNKKNIFILGEKEPLMRLIIALDERYAQHCFLEEKLKLSEDLKVYAIRRVQ